MAERPTATVPEMTGRSTLLLTKLHPARAAS